MTGEELTTTEVELLATGRNGLLHAANDYEKELISTLYLGGYVNLCGAVTPKGHKALSSRGMGL